MMARDITEDRNHMIMTQDSVLDVRQALLDLERAEPQAQKAHDTGVVDRAGRPVMKVAH
jgi:hypothetical protein